MSDDVKFDYDEVLKDTVSKMDGLNYSDYEHERKSAAKYIILAVILVVIGTVLLFLLT